MQPFVSTGKVWAVCVSYMQYVCAFPCVWAHTADVYGLQFGTVQKMHSETNPKYLEKLPTWEGAKVQHAKSSHGSSSWIWVSCEHPDSRGYTSPHFSMQRCPWRCASPQSASAWARIRLCARLSSTPKQATRVQVNENQLRYSCWTVLVNTFNTVK